ncbi:MAG: hypothetical protein CFE44_04085 [Burkholderiales bacterium PBB4]|nr:MAG: hypothetical protein CFE44_04085 [Burkholderiales bacterium PBB4]
MCPLHCLHCFNASATFLVLARVSMDLKRLKHLVALADTRNFGRAAEQCHLSQSAFSRSIQAAEDELSLQLFVRGTLDVRCTPAGEFVLERARKLLFENRCLERDLNLYRERQMGGPVSSGHHRAGPAQRLARALPASEAARGGEQCQIPGGPPARRGARFLPGRPTQCARSRGSGIHPH